MVLDTERERNGSVHRGVVVTFWAVNWKVGTTEFRFFLLVRTSPRSKTTGEKFLWHCGLWWTDGLYRYSKILVLSWQDGANPIPWMILLCREALGQFLRVIIVTTQHLGSLFGRSAMQATVWPSTYCSVRDPTSCHRGWGFSFPFIGKGLN